jgi:hypothetical protein
MESGGLRYREILTGDVAGERRGRAPPPTACGPTRVSAIEAAIEAPRVRAFRRDFDDNVGMEDLKIIVFKYRTGARSVALRYGRSSRLSLVEDKAD